MKFKTAEEKLSHHEEEEPRCLEEKVELIKMIQCYNNLIEAIFVDKKVAIDERNSLPDYKHYVEEKCRLSKSVHKKLWQKEENLQNKIILMSFISLNILYYLLNFILNFIFEKFFAFVEIEGFLFLVAFVFELSLLFKNY